MSVKGLAVSMGLGVAAGAVGIMMLSRKNPARKVVAQAADKIENAAWKVSDKLTKKFDM